MKQIIAITLLFMCCSTIGYAQRNNNNQRQQTTVSKSKQNNSTNATKQRQIEEQRRKEAAEREEKELQDKMRLEQEEQAQQERLRQEQLERQKEERQQQQLAREEAERQARIKEQEELRKVQLLKEQTASEWHTLPFEINGVTFNMVFVKGGRFVMGPTTDFLVNKAGTSPSTLDNIYASTPHYVNLSDYYIGQTEVTIALWTAVMGGDDKYNKQKNDPRTDDCKISILSKRMKKKKQEVAAIVAKGKINWYDCQTFISRLNALTGKNFYLPTEAEWEFAARGGNLSHNYNYPGSNNEYEVKTKDNYYDNIIQTCKCNELGIYDMGGNMYEWCQDWYGTYPTYEVTNPTGPQSGERRILRCNYVSYRAAHKPSERDSHIGLRICLRP